MSESNLRAVIDLGTNTFHLLIAEVEGGRIRERYRERVFVKLAADGITRIGPAPFERGVNTLAHFKKKLDEYNCKSIQAIGTAALRRAANGDEFLLAAKAVGINIQLISGEEEARLITRGVLAALPVVRERVLIMDIGGGSTEYIIVEGEQTLYHASFPVGVSVLKTEFHHQDPISGKEVDKLNAHLTSVTLSLAAALRQYPTYHLAGAAGTFDVLADLLRDQSAPSYPTSHQLDLSGWAVIRNHIVNATIAERKAIPGLPEQRVDMIVVAMLLLDYTLDLAGIKQVTVSQYALKEGVLLDD